MAVFVWLRSMRGGGIPCVYDRYPQSISAEEEARQCDKMIGPAHALTQDEEDRWQAGAPILDELAGKYPYPEA